MLAKCQMLCYSIQVGKRKMLSIRKYGRLVKGLRRRPLTAETGVRFPYLLRLIEWQKPVKRFLPFCYNKEECVFCTNRTAGGKQDGNIFSDDPDLGTVCLEQKECQKDKRRQNIRTTDPENTFSCCGERRSTKRSKTGKDDKQAKKGNCSSE